MSLILSGTDGLSDVDGSAATPAIRGTDANTGMFFPAADTIAFSEGGVERMRILSSGAVAIGNTTDLGAGSLSIQGGIRINGNVGLTMISSNNPPLKLVSNVSTVQDTAIVNNWANGANTGVLVGTSEAGGYALQVSSAIPISSGLPTGAGTVRMVVQGDGNVGIGTNTPASDGPLSLQRDGTSSSEINISLINGISNKECILNFGNNLATAGRYKGRIFYQVDNNVMGFWTNTTERMRITDIGNVGIGSTGKTGTRLNVVSASASVSAGDFYVNAASSTAIPALTLSKYDNNSTTSQVFVQFAINQYAGGSGQINANGSSAAAFGSHSDIRLKENIEPLPAQLGNILALKPCEFDYKAGGHQIGFIAQEMQEVYPDVVGEGADGMLMITGWSKTEARLVKAIQELKATVDAQAVEIAALKAK